MLDAHTQIVCLFWVQLLDQKDLVLDFLAANTNFYVLFMYV